jgi:hypothetical protein
VSARETCWQVSVWAVADLTTTGLSRGFWRETPGLQQTSLQQTAQRAASRRPVQEQQQPRKGLCRHLVVLLPAPLQLCQGLGRHLVMLMPAPLQLCQGRCRHLAVLLPAPLQWCQDLCRHMGVLMPDAAAAGVQRVRQRTGEGRRSGSSREAAAEQSAGAAAVGIAAAGSGAAKGGERLSVQPLLLQSQ